MTALSLILFDVDGTLIDSQAIILESQRRTLAEFGIAHPGREAGLSIVGLSLPRAFSALIGEKHHLDPILKRYGEIFAALRADPAWQSPLFPGARQIVEQFAKRDDLRVGLATGKSRRGVSHLLDQEGWHGMFATVQTADTNPSKPHPGMVLTAAAETGVRVEDVVMIGDTCFDIEMGKAAGARAIGVSWGYHPVKALKEAGADMIARDFGDIDEWIAHDVR